MELKLTLFREAENRTPNKKEQSTVSNISFIDKAQL